MDYNLLKSLSKDILIKLLFELDKQYKSDFRKCYERKLKKGYTTFCVKKDCFKNEDGFYPAEFSNIFIWCEICNLDICKECAKKDNLEFFDCKRCQIFLCRNCMKNNHCDCGLKLEQVDL